MALKTMSIARLQDLRGQADAAIAEKVTAGRQELESELSKLEHVDGHRGAKATRRGAGSDRSHQNIAIRRNHRKHGLAAACSLGG
jgi:hypothetical protein